MKWVSNENLTESKISEITSYIDKELLFSRLCYSLKLNKEELLKYITEEEAFLLISTILANREIDSEEKINSLMNNSNTSIKSPYDLANAKQAADVITTYCNNKNSIIYIYADYDCDGVLSGYVLKSSLEEVSKGVVRLKYPNRTEGYGLNSEWCETIIEQNKGNEDNILVITVDNGVSKRNEVALLQANGIEVIITDHHTSKEDEVPLDCIIVDPHCHLTDQDEYKHLCGCGVAFKVAELVQHNYGIDNMLKYTPHLAIATLADVMTLSDENVALVQYGLEIINSDNCPVGIKALKEIKEIEIVTANDILWTIAPMINACGRMGDSELASKLFFLDDVCSPKEIVEKIDQVNETRKSITKKAKEKISKMNFSNDKVCILPTDEYPTGILGIIAGKITELFNKPSIVVYNHNGECHGSVRSANGINMILLLKELKELKLINNYGGHAEACACGFNIENLELIQEYFNNRITEELYSSESDEEQILNIDEIITPYHFNKVVHALVNIFPCDNRKYSNPIFALTNVQIKSHKRFKSGYTELMLKQGNEIFEASIYGDIADEFINDILPNINNNNEIHIAGTIDKKSFFSSRFQRKVFTLNVVDIKIA